MFKLLSALGAFLDSHPTLGLKIMAVAGVLWIICLASKGMSGSFWNK